MDAVEFMENEELLLVLHCRKTELSCMNNPLTFLSQLRDHDFVPEELYRKVSCMKSKERMKRGVYEILEWVEKNRSKKIQLFWKCVFRDVVLNQYPTLKMLHNSIQDGSYRSSLQSLQAADKKAGDTSEGSRSSDNEKTQASSVKKKKRKSVCDDEQEQPGPSTLVTPSKKKRASKITYSSPLKKGEKGEIWTWPIYEAHLPVTCGNQKGTLQRKKLAKGEKCILAKKRWFTPNEFEKFAGVKSKNWKFSIQCEGVPLHELIQKGHLKCGHFKRGSRRSKKTVLSRQLITDSDEEDEDDESHEDEEPLTISDSEDDDENSGEDGDPHDTSDTDKQEDANYCNDGTQKVFSVTCGSLSGKLYKERFLSGECGKSIRTETSWMTPKDFAKAASGQTRVLWKRDVQCEGKPLGILIEEKILRMHQVNCPCLRCNPVDPRCQENDDECSVCHRQSDDDDVLVVCDFCPRSFHQKCHLPHVEDDQLRDDEEWKCTFCTFNDSEDVSDFEPVEKKRVLSYQMCQYTLECRYLLLFLCSADENQLFATDPSLHMTNYSSVINNPMWLRKVADSLQRKEYQTVGQFVSDVHLIFANCAKYHEDDVDVRAVGEQLNRLFGTKFATVFNVQDEHR